MKYQFSIRTGKKNDQNSAASKAVIDCSALLSQRGYKDYSLVFSEDENKVFYYVNVSIALIKFYFTIHRDAIVGIQYPMLNNVFKYFIKAAKYKNVKIFCIIHDIETLRLGGTDKAAIHQEVLNLNYYDCLMVHNKIMLQWLTKNGITKKMIPLMLFDYLINKAPAERSSQNFSHTICFAGNLTKSSFIYRLHEIGYWNFNVYGPNFQQEKIIGNNVKWGGEFSPEQIVNELNGDFGLIWDGDSIDRCDAILGSYLRYNNPHKFSLYMAAGIPVIAPADAAIGLVIKQYKIGILVESLHDLDHLVIDNDEYHFLQQNCMAINTKITTGNFFLSALDKVEEEIAN